MSCVAGLSMHLAGLSDLARAHRGAPVLHSSRSVPTAAEALLAELSTAARAVGLAFEAQDWASAAFAKVFTDWLSSFTYTRVDTETPSAEFPVIWLIARHDPRLDASPRSTPIVAVALNPATHRFLPITGSSKGMNVPQLATDAGMLTEVVAGIAVSGTHHRLRLGPSSKSLQPAITKLHARLMQVADDLLELVTEGARLRAPKHAALAPMARTLMQVHLKRRRAGLNADIARSVKADILAWAEQLPCKRLQTTPLIVYNHILAAATPAAQKYRKGAVDLLSGSGRLHLADAELWRNVDLGRSPQDILAPLLGVRSSSLRIALMRWSKVFSWRYISYLLPWLDALDPNQWPMSDDDRYAFETAIRMAGVFARTFDCEPRRVIHDWKKQAGHAPWFAIIEAKLARHIDTAQQHAQQQGGQQARYQPLLNPVPHMAHMSLQFVTDVEGVEHMRSDINRRLIFAAIRLEAIRLGVGTHQYADAVHRVGRLVAARVWKETRPSEQMQISARWHAVHRTWVCPPASRSSEASPLANWRTLIAAPLALHCGIVIHPLDSEAKLAEEGAAMHHCVGSMVMECRLSPLHLFSLRNADGTRLSTLSVTSNTSASDGSRRITLRQNLAHHNRAPPDRAVQAASEFIARIHAAALPQDVSAIVVDWAAIDASRQPLLRSHISDQQEFGFAIHDVDVRATMVRLIWPCLPRHLKSRARATAGDARVTFADLSAAAAVPAAMAAWWQSRDGS